MGAVGVSRRLFALKHVFSHILSALNGIPVRENFSGHLSDCIE